MRSCVLLVVLLAACGGDDGLVDAPTLDGAADAPPIDAAVDAPDVDAPAVDALDVDTPAIDAAAIDAAAIDAAAIDAAAIDAAAIDAAAIDASAIDASAIDAAAIDAAVIDASVIDAAVIDAAVIDAAPIDAAATDAAAVDAAAIDAPAIDAAIDAAATPGALHLDPTFAAGAGWTTFSSRGIARRVQVRPDRRPLVCGEFPIAGFPVTAFVLRANVDGALDPTYGVVYVDQMGSPRCALADDGRMLVAGESTWTQVVTGGPTATIRIDHPGLAPTHLLDDGVWFYFLGIGGQRWRFDHALERDTTYGTAVTCPGSSPCPGEGLWAAPGGRLMMRTGTSLLRLDADTGEIDGTYGTQGSTTVGGQVLTARADGSMIALAWSSGTLTVTEVAPDGTAAAPYTVPLADGPVVAVVDAAGRLVMLLPSLPSAEYRLARLDLAAHALDTTFGPGGVATADITLPLNPDGSSPVVGNIDLAIDSAGAFVVAGTFSSPYPPLNHLQHPTLARLVE